MKHLFQVEIDRELDDTIERHLAITNMVTRREYLATLVAIADHILESARENQFLAFISEDEKEFHRFIVPSFDAVRRRKVAASQATQPPYDTTSKQPNTE